VYFAVARWNDYFTALVYIRDRFKLPLQTVLREVVATMTTTNFFDAYMDTQGIVEATRKAQVAKYCAIIISTAPTVVLYMAMQKFFVQGVLIGSIKG
jgi:putative aldouronate transport system permease protein